MFKPLSLNKSPGGIFEKQISPQGIYEDFTVYLECPRLDLIISGHMKQANTEPWVMGSLGLKFHAANREGVPDFIRNATRCGRWRVILNLGNKLFTNAPLHCILPSVGNC